MEGGLPFDVKQPRYNAATEAAMREALEIINGQRDARRYSSTEELFHDLYNEPDVEKGDD